MMRRGEVWVGNLNPSRANEIGKVRPVLIVQANELTAAVTPMVIILPLTTRVFPGFRHWRVNLPARDRLIKPSQVVTDQPRALDRSRFGEGPLTTLTAEEMTAVDKSLRAVMGML